MIALKIQGHELDSWYQDQKTNQTKMKPKKGISREMIVI